MSRIRLKTPAEAPERFREFMLRRGDLNVFRLLANAPAVFGGWTRMVDELLDSPTFTPRLRELVILRVASLQRCRYELAQHTDRGLQAGITARQLDAVTGTGELDDIGLDPTELAVLRLVTELCVTHQVGQDAFDAVLAALGTEATTELMILISSYYGLAFILNAVDLDIDTRARLREV
ncbi:MAG: carboxymuconolactone decarboxylase family protein [Pseudonocardiales bacterium]|nr:carboxymuconolactone decarboxylase family protein [Pseudonocardiales bacterium]